MVCQKLAALGPARLGLAERGCFGVGVRADLGVMAEHAQFRLDVLTAKPRAVFSVGNGFLDGGELVEEVLGRVFAFVEGRVERYV